MISASSSLIWALLIALGASQNTTAGGSIFSTIKPSTDLIWQPCLTKFFCAVLDVPLDYAKPDGYRASVPLVKLPAMANSTDGPYKGMILTNPGGPGGVGTLSVIDDGTALQAVTGTNFDLVAFDPRGIGSSIPSASCNDPSLPTSMKARRGLPKIHGPEFLDSAAEALFPLAKVEGAYCQARIGGEAGAGPHMTTAVNTRDMVSILDAFSRSSEANGLTDASMLNYWGFSYGTVIGQMFANLFPERVGRVVVDGVVDPAEWVTGIHLHSVTDTDKVLATFFVYCHLAGPKLCPYYTGTTARDIYLRFEKSFVQLDPRGGTLVKQTNAAAVEAALESFKSSLFLLAYQPIPSFPRLAATLVAIEQALNNASFESVLPRVPKSEIFDILEIAVECTDDGGASFNLTYDQLRPYIYALAKESTIAGELSSVSRIACTGWPIRGVDLYFGPFGGSTKNPLLFVSNTLDPITPHRNGRKWSSEYTGAQLLTIEAQGHTSFSAQNTCAYEKIHTFFQTGELPGRQNHCKQEVGAFNVTIPGRLEKRGDWNDVRLSLRALRQRFYE